MHAYLPIVWSFGDAPCDGRGGPPVKNAGTLYLVGDKDESSPPTSISLMELIDDALDISSADGVIGDNHVAAFTLLRQSFLDAAEHINTALKAKPKKGKLRVLPANPQQTVSVYLEKNGPLIARLCAGENITAVANELGLSRQSLHATWKKFSTLEASLKSKNPLDSLSVRARSCLGGEGLESVEAIRAVIDSGQLNKIPNMGAKTIAELLDWSARLP